MKRPLLWPAVAFAGGVALGEWWRPALVVLFVGAMAGLLLAAWRERLRPWLLLGVGFLAGWLSYTVHQTVKAPHDLRRLGEEAVLAAVRGRIADTPALRLVERRGELAGRTGFRFHVEALRREGGEWEPATGAIAVSLREPPPPEFFRGQRLELFGVLKRPDGPEAEGLFDYRAHLRRQGVWFVLFANDRNDWQVSGGQPDRRPWSERFLPWARRTLALGLPDTEATRLLWAMGLGWRTALSGEVDVAFMRSGTMHVFAISGLHIAMIAGTLVALLRVARVSRAWCGVIALPLIWFYVAATGWQPSAVRSAIMTSIVVGGWALTRPVDLVNSLAAAALVVLLLEPGQLFQASFQLSFGVVFGMALLVPLLEPRLLRLLRFDPDPFLPAELRPRWQRWLEYPLRLLALSLATGVAAFVSSLPFIVHHFHLLSPVSLLANVAVVPMSSLSLASMLAALAFGGWAPAVAEVFNASAWAWMNGMVIVSRWAAELPGGSWHVAAPDWRWWLPYYAVLLAVATGLAWRGRGRWWTGGLAVASVLAFVITSRLGQPELRLTVLTGGTALWIDAADNAEDLLLDCGNEATATRLVVPFLRSRGLDRLESLLVSHGDLQHVGGGPLVVAELRPRRVGIGGPPGRSAAYRDFVRLVETNDIPVRRLVKGDLLAGWEVLHPGPDDRFAAADDNAVVLRRDVSGVRLVLLGDLGRHGQRRLVEQGTDLKCDVVVTGLPRDGEPLGSELLTLLNPRLIVVTSATSPAPERVRPATRQRLERSGCPVIFSEEAGAVTLEILDGKLRWWAMNGQTGALQAP